MNSSDSTGQASDGDGSSETTDVGAGTVLDTRGLRCPEPVMLLHKAIAPLSAGDALTVLASDPTTQRDIPQFCRFLGHELRDSRQQDDEFIFTLIKGA